MSAPSLIAVLLDTRLNDMEGRIRTTRTRRMRARTRVHRSGRENRNNNDNNDHDDNIGSKIHRRERRGEGEIRAVNLGFPEATKRYLALPVF